uniref:TMV resistance protein N n=1 Tax=Cajanus cajan TaxID=3821 RepID=A0A151QY28_CAJCA|nr:TMV resistance protein N [Cajanus cajan]
MVSYPSPHTRHRVLLSVSLILCVAATEISEPSLSRPPRSKKYEVFVSFRGKGIRGSFPISGMIKVFSVNQILAFVDYGQVVIPVFYRIDPSHVSHPKGTYGNAFKETAHLSTHFRKDDELVDEIVNCMSMKLNAMYTSNSKGLIGIEKPIAHIKSLLRKGSNEARAVGIWGMGGIGKTTIAEEVFYRLCAEFHGCCFLANVREESRKHGIIYLKEKLYSTLLEEDLKIDTTNGLPSYVKKKLGSMKVLIVLDDVNDSDQLKILVGAHDWFGSGSKIIITSRDKQVLRNEVDHIYKVGVLDFDDALKLFKMNAFKQNHLEIEYYELSKRIVNYAKGIPLVLKVLGHLLCGKDKELWESQLYKLKRLSSKKIYDVMKLSYDDLDCKEKKIFLDLACFFSELFLEVDYIKILLKDSKSDNSIVVGLERLKDKSLINVSEDNIVYMHDIIQKMGWEIVRQESNENSGSLSRLWDSDDIYKILKNNKGTEAIRSIRTHLSVIKKLKLSPDIFVRMSKLQFMDFHSENEFDGLDILPEGLEYLPTELRYLRWMNYPLKSLPDSFSAENLVILDLSYSRLETLWHGEQVNMSSFLYSFYSNNINSTTKTHVSCLHLFFVSTEFGEFKTSNTLWLEIPKRIA